MTMKKLSEIVLVLQSVTNNKNRPVVMDDVIDLIKCAYAEGVEKKDSRWLISALENAKVVTK